MNARNHEPELPFVPGETEYLITDVEELVNDNIGNYLSDQPFRIKVIDYTPAMTVVDNIPHLPTGITEVKQDIVNKVVPGARQFLSMDLNFSFPVEATRGDENPINVELKWSDGIHVVLAIVDKRPVVLVTKGENGDEVLFAGEPPLETMQTYLKSVGLPQSFWGDDFKDLMGDIYSAPDIKIERHSNHLLDLGTSLEISHNIHYATTIDDEKEVVQELCFNIDHESTAPYSSFNLTPQMFRNMIRFERSEDGYKWKYRGAYAGKLESGKFIDQLVQRDPKLGVPGSKLLEKAFLFLSEEQPKR